MDLLGLADDVGAKVNKQYDGGSKADSGDRVDGYGGKKACSLQLMDKSL